jgi:hypothetical protein
MWWQPVLHFSGLSITLAPSWRYFFWGFVFVTLLNTGASTTNLFRPYWTWGRASIRLVSDLIGSTLFCLFLRSDIVASISVANVDAAKTSQITNAINWWSDKMFPGAVVASVIIAVVNTYRVFRVRARAAHRVALNTACGMC